MAMGMTPDEYWNQDSTWTKAYRESFRIQRDAKNADAWLQGRYVYDAICAVAPILRAFSKAKKPLDYVKEPYAITHEQLEERERENERKNYELMLAKMQAFVADHNRRFTEGDKNHG